MFKLPKIFKRKPDAGTIDKIADSTVKIISEVQQTKRVKETDGKAFYIRLSLILLASFIIIIFMLNADNITYDQVMQFLKLISKFFKIS